MACAGTLPTYASPHSTQHQRTPAGHHSHHPPRKIQMGLSPQFHHPVWRCPPQGEEAVAQRTNHHLVLPLIGWQPLTNHQPRPGHHSSTPLPPTARTPLHSPNLATFPHPSRPCSSRHHPPRNQRRPCWCLQFHNTACLRQSTAASSAIGNNNILLTHSPSMCKPPTLRNAPTIVAFALDACIFRPATIPTNKFVAQGLAPSCHRPLATSPSPS